MKFEEFQKICAQNKQDIERMSNKITPLVSLLLVAVGAIFINFFYENSWLLAIFLFLGVYKWSVYGEVEDRVFSKCPAKIAVCAIVAISIALYVRTDFFANGFSPIVVGKWILVSFFVWWFVWFVNLIVVATYESTDYVNPKWTFSSRVEMLDHKRVDHKRGYTDSYYVYFYNYLNKISKFSIDEDKFNSLERGDAINVVVQPQVGGIKIENVVKLLKFKGQTDVEKLVNKEDNKSEGSTLPFASKIAVVGCVSGLLHLFLSGSLNVLNCPAVYSFAYVVAGIILACLLIFEWRRVKTTSNGVILWKDYLLPKAMIYFVSVYAALNLLLTVYNDYSCPKSSYSHKTCSITDLNLITELKSGRHGKKSVSYKYFMCFVDKDGLEYNMRITSQQYNSFSVGDMISVTISPGALGVPVIKSFSENK